MISHKHNFIFIHIPKTGGNSIQAVLAPFSDDRIEARHGHQDGVDRFAVTGRLTPDKHVPLGYYARRVQIERFKVATCVRHPVDRLLSFYFSPSNWVVERDGGWHVGAAHWDRERFLANLAAPAADFLKIGGEFRPPDNLMRFESLQADFARFLHDAGIPATAPLRKLNVSRGSSETFAQAKADPIVAAVARSRYREDFERFGFELP